MMGFILDNVAESPVFSSDNNSEDMLGTEVDKYGKDVIFTRRKSSIQSKGNNALP